MAGKLYKFTFHGAFGSRAAAEKKSESREGSFVKAVTYRKKKGNSRGRGKEQHRWVVMMPR